MKSTTAPVATIGGGADGRAPVVVEEPVIPVVEPEHTTSIAFGQAEPGKNIFAGEPVREIKSDPGVILQPVGEQPVVEKVVSQAFQATTEASASESTAPVATTVSTEASVADAKLVIQTAPAVQSTVQQATVESTAEAAAPKAPAGPLDEVAAEADRVAKDLYPDAQEEK